MSRRVSGRKEKAHAKICDHWIRGPTGLRPYCRGHSSRAPLRKCAAQVETTNGPFMNPSLPLAGFAIIEAVNLAEAVDIVLRTPCAVMDGVVEVWPLRRALQGWIRAK